MPKSRRLGKVQRAIVDHVKGLEPKARATTHELLEAVREATGKKKISKQSLLSAIRSLRDRGVVKSRRIGRELRVWAAKGTSAVEGSATKVEGTVERAAGRVRAGARAAGEKISESVKPAPEPASTPSVVGVKLAPGESVVLHVEKDVVHVLENVHGRIEHRKIARKE